MSHIVCSNKNSRVQRLNLFGGRAKKSQSRFHLPSKQPLHHVWNIRGASRGYQLAQAVAALLLFMQTEVFAQGAGRAKVSEGNRAYAEEKFDEANDKYRDAQVDNPESPIIHFNIGDALYQKNNYEEALKSYQSAVQKTNDPKLQAQGYYNLGNTLFRMDKWQESIAAYQQALKLNPNDEDAKFNLEYVRRKIKENAQKQPQDQQQQQQNQQQQQEQQQNQKDGNDKKEQQEQEQQEQKQQQGEQKQDQKEQQQQGEEQQEQQQQGQQAKAGELSKEEAERLLEALQNQEKEAQKKKQAQMRGRVRVDKDW